MIPGTQLAIRIIKITQDSEGTMRGIAISDQGKLVVIEGVEEGDIDVSIEVTKIYKETIFSKKIGNRISEKPQATPGTVDSPYEMDIDEEDDDD